MPELGLIDHSPQQPVAVSESSVVNLCHRISKDNPGVESTASHTISPLSQSEQRFASQYSPSSCIVSEPGTALRELIPNATAALVAMVARTVRLFANPFLGRSNPYSLQCYFDRQLRLVYVERLPISCSGGSDCDSFP